MKARFSTLDIMAIVPELKGKLCTGWRVNQVYDCDYKTYLFKLNKSIVQMKKDEDAVAVDEETANKMTFIIESGQRMHTSDYDWPKSPAPSQFSTKLRKSIRNKRIEDIKQVGIDRLIDIQFGSGQAANHLMVELYDRGNLILTDHNYCILAILRWRKPDKDAPKPATNNDDSVPADSEDFKVGMKYPLSRCRKEDDLEPMTQERIVDLLNNARVLLYENPNFKKRNKANKNMADSDALEINLKDLLNPYVIYGSSLLEDKLMMHLESSCIVVTKKCTVSIPKDEFGKLRGDIVQKCAEVVRCALEDADITLKEVRDRKKNPGYIVQREQTSGISQKLNEGNKQTTDATKTVKTNIDFFPILSCAERRIKLEGGNLSIEEFESFDKAVDIYYCNLESQKIETQALSAEKEARKKLDNLKIAQERRLDDLARTQKEDEDRARLIEMNSDKVDQALLIIRSMLANQMSWADIKMTIKQAQAANDPIASLITQVKFDRNEFTMCLCDPYESSEDEQTISTKNNKKGKPQPPKQKGKNIDIDIGLSAYANARRFFVKRRTAVNKERKTIEVSKKAFKNVERQTKEMLKDMIVKTNITKARKRFWFENFFWFISSDGYLVVAGRDAEQNELLVKRYMKNNDIYVHADLHGASSVIIKNEFTHPVPPKTLTEAGTMAVCYSSAWDSKIASTSYWVYPNQVSKTAPTGEYLTLGAFIIRGKKNFLPLSNLVLGFGFLFRLDEESIERRKEARLAKEKSSASSVAPSEGDEKPEENDASASEAGDDQIQDYGDSDSDDSAPEEKQKDESKSRTPEDKVVESQENDQLDGEILDDDDDLDLENRASEHRLIDTVTENPLPDDVILYAIAMCGPYTALSSFKYKVKVIPGANKRGKAAKACLSSFMHDKRASKREKDLLRALKDQDYARNIPNKVKISATNMKTITKRRPKKSEVRLPPR